MAGDKRKPPVRKSAGGMITDRLRVAVERAICEMDRRGQPLHLCIADGMAKDPAKMLSAIRGLLPVEHNVAVLDVTAMHLQAVRELSRMHALPSPAEDPMPVVIDAVAEDLEVAEIPEEDE
jgi:hypothetical protein